MARKAANSSTDKINKVTGTVIFISVKVIVYIIVALVFYYGITGAVGYSALLMCQVMPSDCTITTIEKYEKRIPEARRNFARAGESDRIRLIEGDAAEVLSGLDGPYDFIFMDAAKGQYVHFLPQALKLLPPGGLLVSDNVLQDGDVIESRYAVTRRNRTIHTRMREYLYRLKHMEELETAIVPIGDGVTISTRVR